MVVAVAYWQSSPFRRRNSSALLLRLPRRFTLRKLFREPVKCFFHLRMVKVADIRLHKVASNFWRDGQKTTVTYRGYFLNFPMMIFNEFKMSD